MILHGDMKVADCSRITVIRIGSSQRSAADRQ
jgi:hypothetical protein